MLFSESWVSDQGFLFSVGSEAMYILDTELLVCADGPLLQMFVFINKAEKGNNNIPLEEGLLAFWWLLYPGNSLLLLASSFNSPSWICHLSPIIRIDTKQSSLGCLGKKRVKMNYTMFSLWIRIAYICFTNNVFNI